MDKIYFGCCSFKGYVKELHFIRIAFFRNCLNFTSNDFKMLSQKDILTKLKELKPFLIEEYGIKTIGLFGSFSQNEASEDSDIDLLVEYERYLGWKTIHLGIYLEGIFGRKIDLVSKKALKARIKNSIMEQVLYVK